MPMTFADRGPVARPALPYAASLLALLLAAGCTSGSPTPAGSTSVATTTSSSAATTSAAPTTTAKPSPSLDPVIAKIPAAARPESIEGAAAFAKFYFEQLNRSFRAGSPRLLDGLYANSCAICVDLRKSAEELSAKGLHHEGDTLTVTFSSTTVFNRESRQVLVKLDQHAVAVVDAAGKQKEKTNAGSGAFVAVVEFNKHWIVTDLGQPS
jgi:hypothetical protein